MIVNTNLVWSRLLLSSQYRTKNTAAPCKEKSGLQKISLVGFRAAEIDYYNHISNYRSGHRSPVEYFPQQIEQSCKLFSHASMTDSAISRGKEASQLSFNLSIDLTF